MPKRKRLKDIDDTLLLQIETAVAQGAATNGAIAKAIGWPVSTFKNYRYGKGGSERYQPFIEPIETAIKKGFSRRRETMLSMGEDAVAYLLRHDTYTERHQIRRRVPKRRRGAGGEWEEYVEEVNEHRVVEKRRNPNPIIAMFVCVNASQTDPKKRNIGWKSINQVASKMVADEGAIMGRIDNMLEPAPGESADEPPAPKPTKPKP